MSVHQKRSRKNQKGVTLIGVVMAASLLGFLTLVTLTLADVMTKMASKSKFDHEVATDLTLLRLSFANASACGANLAGTVVSPTYTKLPLNKSSFKFPRDKGSTELGTQSILSDSSHLKTISLKLEAPGSDLARLKLDFESPGSSIGGSELSRDLILSVNLDGSNQIVSCSSNTSVGNTTGDGSDPRGDALHLANQGKGCDGPPPGRSPGLGGVFGVGGPLSTEAQKESAINALCDAQSYPVNGSIRFLPGCNRTNTSTDCRVLRGLAQSEGGTSSFRNLRQNYETAEECKGQFANSQGAQATTEHNSGCSDRGSKTRTTYLCIQGRWAVSGSSCVEGTGSK